MSPLAPRSYNRAAGAVSSEQRWKVVGSVSLVAISLLMLATVSDYGMTWDEEFHNTYGEYVLAWFESGFQDKRALNYKNSYIYGALFDVLALLFARISPLGLYEDRHLVNVAFAILALTGTWRLGTLILGARGGALAVALTALTPMFYGHSFNNPKDIPFAALFVWTLYYLYKSARPLPASSRETAKLSGSLGAMLATRPGGVFFIAYIVVWWCLSLWRARARRRDVHRAIAALALVILVGWVLMLTFWPWGQINPIIHPLAGIAIASRFSYAMTTLFHGQQVPALKPPLSYLPTFFGLQLPEIYFVAAVAGIVGCLAGLRIRADAREAAVPRVELGFLAFAVLFPIATAMTLRSTLYDAIRHFLFVIPPLAILAAAGIESGLRSRVPRPLRIVIAGLAVITATLTVGDMITLHPYESIYYNRLVAGGLPGVRGRFETEYWGSSYREAVQWVMENVPGDGVRIANCSNQLQTSYYLRGPQGARFISVAIDDKPDLLVATERWDCHRRIPGQVLHTVERQGVPLAYVIDVRTR
jgi:4-amino-4-deoxy-L-arabinose transferase-like glycosyltransferase